MADREITEQCRCGYCYEEFNSMADPKELPCHHVFCLRCLQGSSCEIEGICCPMCQTTYRIENLETLPTVRLSKKRPADTTPTCEYDGCEGQAQPAIYYCLQCQCQICDTHQQSEASTKRNHEAVEGIVFACSTVANRNLESHDSTHKDKHQLIPVSEYETSPKKYKIVRCQQHSEDLVKACTTCYVFLCEQCSIPDVLCIDGKNEHNFNELCEIEGQITTHFKDILKSAGDKLTEICKLDKQAWKALDEEEKKCVKKIEMVEHIRCDLLENKKLVKEDKSEDKEITSQIQLIDEESEKLKKQINEFQKETVNRVEAYTCELIAKKDCLDGLRAKLYKLMKYSHVTEQIHMKEQITEEFMRILKTGLNKCELGTTALISNVNLLPLQTKLIYLPASHLPASLTFLSEEEIGTWFGQSISCTDKGGLMVASDRGIIILDDTSDGEEHSADEIEDEYLISAIPHRQNVFVIKVEDSCFTVIKGLLNGTELKERDSLFHFDWSDDDDEISPSLSVSDNYVVATEPAAKKLYLYNVVTKLTTVLQPVRSPQAVHFLPNGDLLVVSRTSEALTKYSVENSQLTEIWTCEGLKDALDVCTDADGLIYVCIAKNAMRDVEAKRVNTLYIISPDGSLLKEIKGRNLPDNFKFLLGSEYHKNDSFCIKGDEIAVISSGEPFGSYASVLKFKINRQTDYRLTRSWQVKNW